MWFLISDQYFGSQMSLRKPVEGAPKQHFPSALRGLASQAGRRLRKLALADPSPCRQRALRSVVLLLLLLLLLPPLLMLLPLLHNISRCKG